MSKQLTPKSTRAQNLQIKPDYENRRSFANIPGSVYEAFGLRPKYSALHSDIIDMSHNKSDLLCIYLDNLGWNIWKKYLVHAPSLKPWLDQGILSISRITSQYPSNTGGHATTMFTGLPAFMTGFYEFRIYNDTVGDTIMPLRFMRVLGDGNDSLLAEGFNPEQILPKAKLLSELKEAGIHTHTFLSTEIQYSAYNDYFCADSERYAFDGLPESFATLQQAIVGRDREQRNFFYYYYEGADKASHKYGPESIQHLAEVETFFELLNKYILTKLKNDKDNLKVVLFSDHGQIGVDPAITIYLDKELPQLSKYMIQSRSGEPIEAAGNSRDLFLHIQPEYRAKAYKEISEVLQGKAEVFTKAEFLAAGWFGHPPTAVVENFADIVVMPTDNNNIAWAGSKDKKFSKIGMHGGAHPNEMHTPLLYWSFSNN